MNLTQPAEIMDESATTFRVLLIEDHQDTALMMQCLLEREGYVVTIARSAAEAIAIGSREKFDVVVTDLRLPDGNGAEVLSVLRNHNERLPAIAVTGVATIDMAAAARRMGFSEYLVKPIRLEDLRAALAACVRG